VNDLDAVGLTLLDHLLTMVGLQSLSLNNFFLIGLNIDLGLPVISLYINNYIAFPKFVQCWPYNKTTCSRLFNPCVDKRMH